MDKYFVASILYKFFCKFAKYGCTNTDNTLYFYVWNKPTVKITVGCILHI